MPGQGQGEKGEEDGDVGKTNEGFLEWDPFVDDEFFTNGAVPARGGSSLFEPFGEERGDAFEDSPDPLDFPFPMVVFEQNKKEMAFFGGSVP